MVVCSCLEQNQPLLCHTENKMEYLLDVDHVFTDSRCLHVFFFFFLPFYLIGKLNMDLVGFESIMPLSTLFLWWVEVLFETRNICLSDMILVQKSSPEDFFFFFGWFQIRRKLSIKRQCKVNKKVFAEVFFYSDFLVIIMCNLAYCSISRGFCC